MSRPYPTLALVRRVARLPTKRILHELYCWAAVLFIPASYYLGGPLGLVTNQVFGALGSVLMDVFLVSPTAKKNMDILRSNGYSDTFVWSVIIFNLITSNTGLALIVDYFECFQARRHWDLDLIAKVLVNLSIAEIAFTVNHTILHHTKWGARLHIMHHFCQPCSWAANLIFHPLDLAAEFSGPVLSLILSHCLWFQDPFAFLVSLQVLNLWYAIDHSENLKLHHYVHHSSVDKFYSIYTRIENPIHFGGSCDGKSRDEVVKLMLEKRHKVNFQKSP
jgi:sterol desaturase/sphingolipid hydroxylase (fatty acid hydroxylase superfamily)